MQANNRIKVVRSAHSTAQKLRSCASLYAKRYASEQKPGFGHWGSSMKSVLNLLVVVAALVTSAQAHAITGTEYLGLNETQRQAWVVGAVDGILTAQLWQTNKEPEISKCLVGLHPTQVKAIFEKALNANPESWHFPAAFQLLTTLQEFCSRKQ
jgi:hypothetical protein